jgi:tetratricopeptide (TPR) repeat protein
LFSETRSARTSSCPMRGMPRLWRRREDEIQRPGHRPSTCYIANVKRWLLSAALTGLFLPGPLSADSVRETRRLYLQARRSVAEGQFRDALDLYRRLIRELPEDAVVRYEYAQLLRDLNVLDEAVLQAREAVRLDSNLAESHRLLGTLELGAGESDPARLDRAIEELRLSRRLAPSDTGTAAALARALLARGRPAEAAKLLDEVPETRTQPLLMRLEAEARARSGHTSDAETLYRTLLQSDPADRDVTAALVDLYEEQDRIDQALSLLQDLQKRDPENPAVAQRITLDLARAGRFEDAEKRARDLAARRPENREIRRLLAQVLLEKGDLGSGEKILRDLLSADPEDEASRHALAAELLRQRRFEDAQPMLEESLRRAGTDPKAAGQRQSATVELGYLAFLRKDYAAARIMLEPVALSGKTVGPRAMRILFALARDTEDFAYGLDRSRAAAAAEPDNPEWLAALAEFQSRSGNRKEAEGTLLRLSGSEELERVLAAADAYARLKDYANAARVAREATKEFPESTEALFRLASSLERAGTAADAEKVFLQLLEIRPNDATAQNYLGYMWADRGAHLERALELLEKAVAREPRNGAYRDSLGWVYFRMGRLELAASNLRQAHQSDPDDPTIEEHLGDLSEKQGNVAAAVTHWERALVLKHEEPEKVKQKLARYRAKNSSGR